MNELGFIGCNLNPDPSGGYWTSPPLTDKHWYPLYEKMVELDVPAMVHVSSSCNPNFHATGAHYINADTTAFMQFLTSDLFKDFPTLRFVIPHGGGAVPYHWGRYRGLAQDMKRPPLGELLLRNVFFDTCVYHQPGIDLLAKVIPVENVLFGSEMVGAVRGIDPETGHNYDDTKRYIDALAAERCRQAQDLLGERGARLPAPRAEAGGGRPMSTTAFTMDANYRPYHPNPRKPAYVPPVGAVDAHCHVFGPGDTFPYAPERKYTPCDAPKEKLFELRDFLGFDKNVIVQASCHGRDNTALVDALRASDGKAKGVAVVRYDIGDDELKELDDAGVCAVRFNFVKRLVDATPRENYLRVAEKIAPLGWHIVVYFEAQDLEDLDAVHHLAPRDDRGRPHGPPGRRERRRPSRLSALRAVARRARQHLGEGDLPRAAHRQRPAVRRRRAVPAHARRALPRPRAVGHRLAAPEHDLDRPRRRRAGRPDPAHRDDTGAAAEAAGRQPQPPLLARERATMSDNAAFDDIPGTILFDANRSRQGYHLNMFCMSLMKAENRDAFRADERAYLAKFPMTPEQTQAILERNWNRMLELGGNIYYTAKLAACDGLSFQQIAAMMTGSSQEDYAKMMLDGGRPPEGNRSKSEWKRRG